MDWMDKQPKAANPDKPIIIIIEKEIKNGVLNANIYD